MKPLLLLACALPLFAQQSQIGADFAGEKARFDKSCLDFKAAGCAQLLFTDHPLHLAAGSLAPQNGFGLGPALVLHYTPNERWRLSWDTDAEVTPNGSWRAGAYMTAVLIRHTKIVVTTGAAKPHSNLTVPDMPVFHVYAQGISLNKLWFFGLGQGTTPAQRADFGMREAILGTDVIFPLSAALHLSFFGEANGRFTTIRSEHGGSIPSVFTIYNPVTAPGLLTHPGYAQLGEGLRVKPEFAHGHVRLNYSAAIQEWATGQTNYSFTRFRADLDNQFPIYGKWHNVAPNAFNGPDECGTDPASPRCPTIAQTSQNVEGSFDLRFLYTATSSATVPFYYDPTLGGSDLNGTTLLGSYPDYRFRGPDAMVLRAAFEHSIYKWPIGAKLMLDEGKVGFTRSDLGWDHLAHSYAAGITVHAGGLPVIDLLFAWGGHEGHHTIANVSTSLLGGNSRPNLY